MVGERLLHLRHEADLTQDELADILCINKHSISSYERNKSEPPDDIKIAIAAHFGVSIDYLLGVTDNPASHKEQSNCLRLPVPLTTQEQASVADYIAFLLHKRSLRK